MYKNSTTYKLCQNKQNIDSFTDITLIGAGIMSATIGMFITILEPSWKIYMYERLKKPAQESSNAWNNAGTGHAAFCELNYTEYNNKTDSINIEKAITINNAFELSLQFWAYLTKKNIFHNPTSFINSIPHISFVWGSENILFLKKRFHALKKHIIFNDMTYSENPNEISSWVPILMQGRDTCQKIAATRMEMGTDVNFEEITHQLLTQLQNNPNFNIYLQHDVTHIQYNPPNTWNLTIKDTKNNNKKHINTRYLFIGGGGQTLNILQTSKIPEIKGYAGFPVGGQFLVTYNPKIISKHAAKVYGKTSKNMPPMSIPHIDTRTLYGKKVILFGPFATFSSKFLKHGSWLDLFYSLNKDNIIPMIQSGIDNFKLIKYLINQLMMSNKDRINSLKEYYPNVNPKDWSLIQAGQRVQIIKKNNKNRGVLQFGTEIIHSNHGSLTALLGASPGASICVSIAIKLLNIMFKNQFHSNKWKNKLTEMVPSYSQNTNIINNTCFDHKIKEDVRNILNLNNT